MVLHSSQEPRLERREEPRLEMEEQQAVQQPPPREAQPVPAVTIKFGQAPSLAPAAVSCITLSSDEDEAAPAPATVVVKQEGEGEGKKRSRSSGQSEDEVVAKKQKRKIRKLFDSSSSDSETMLEVKTSARSQLSSWSARQVEAALQVQAALVAPLPARACRVQVDRLVLPPGERVVGARLRGPSLSRVGAWEKVEPAEWARVCRERTGGSGLYLSQVRLVSDYVLLG